MGLKDRIKSASKPLFKNREFKITYERLNDDNIWCDFEHFLNLKEEKALQTAYDVAYNLTDKHPFKIFEMLDGQWVKVADLYSKYVELD